MASTNRGHDHTHLRRSETPTISVVVSTFGDVNWIKTAQRALKSAAEQTVPAHEVLFNHADTLHDARNIGAAQATGDWLCFLDADDELSPGFIDAMQRTATDAGNALIRPATLGVYPDGHVDERPVVLPERPLLQQNFMIIATLVPNWLFHDVGGFADWPIYEDWDLWIRCTRAGARHLACPDAVYRVHVADASRNQQDRDTQVRFFHEIRNQYRR